MSLTYSYVLFVSLASTSLRFRTVEEGDRYKFVLENENKLTAERRPQQAPSMANKNKQRKQTLSQTQHWPTHMTCLGEISAHSMETGESYIGVQETVVCMVDLQVQDRARLPTGAGQRHCHLHWAIPTTSLAINTALSRIYTIELV
ncbi:hypothetical protein J6590_023991 [Homalodisca vitripennis]|nr:hypothetical protein J6590_023991 [Homalodisca vitripennis]